MEKRIKYRYDIRITFPARKIFAQIQDKDEMISDKLYSRAGTVDKTNHPQV